MVRRLKFFCDTTVLFAASDHAHTHHQPSLEIVRSAAPAHAFVAAHSLAELYATLWAAPVPKMRRLDHILEAVEQAGRVFTPVSLTTDDYRWVLRQAATAGARSGQIYDALILKCAERVEAEVVYTWNTQHFQRIAWPAMVGRIRSP